MTDFIMHVFDYTEFIPSYKKRCFRSRSVEDARTHARLYSRIEFGYKDAELQFTWNSDNFLIIHGKFFAGRLFPENKPIADIILLSLDESDANREKSLAGEDTIEGTYCIRYIRTSEKWGYDRKDILLRVCKEYPVWVIEQITRRLAIPKQTDLEKLKGGDLPQV